MDSNTLKSDELQAAKLRRIWGSCPLCYANFAGHSYAQFAMTVISPDNKNRVSELERALAQEDWRTAADIQEFEGSKDTLMAYALRCSAGLVGLLVIRDAWELWDDGNLIRWRALSSKSGSALESLIPQECWRPILSELKDDSK